MKPEISFFTENIKFTFRNKQKVRKWINEMIESENKLMDELTIIFCDDNYLAMLSTTYLNVNHFTDVITFDYKNPDGTISGDVFISIERVKDNSKTFKTNFNNELHRITSHGILHLLGYRDKTKKQKKEMTLKEDEYLTKLNLILIDK